MIKVFDPEITQKDIQSVTECLQRGELSGRSPVVKEFEDEFARYCGVFHASSVNSGSSALFLALKALDLPPGARVVIPSFGYIAVPNAVIQAGLVPITVDVDTSTGNISVQELEKSIMKAQAIIVIHTYGFPCDMNVIMKLAQKHDCYVIEDAAEAHGAEMDGKKVGSFGDIGVFSFFANKIITTGEGGMVITNSTHLIDRVNKLKDQFNGKRKYYHEGHGYSLCMGAIQASLGLSQLSRIDSILDAKHEIAQHYYRNLHTVTPLTSTVGHPVYWAFGVLSDRRDELAQYLHEHKIDTRPFFSAYHVNPFLRHLPIRANAEYLQNHGLYLPSSHTLTRKEQDYVCETVNSFQ